MEVIIYDLDGKVIAEKKQEKESGIETLSHNYELLLSDTENEIEFVKLKKSKKDEVD